MLGPIFHQLMDDQDLVRLSRQVPLPTGASWCQELGSWAPGVNIQPLWGQPAALAAPCVQNRFLHFTLLCCWVQSGLKNKEITGERGEDQMLNCVGRSIPENTVLNVLIMLYLGRIVIYANPETVVESTISYAHYLKEMVLIFCMNTSSFFLPSLRLCRCLFYSKRSQKR